MAENKTERVPLLISPSDLRAIDDWGFENRIRSRAEAMRELMRRGLDAERSKKNAQPLVP